MKTLLSCLGLSLAVPWAEPSGATPEEPAAAGPVLDVGNRGQVFVDGKYLTSPTNVALKMHPPRKTGERTSVADRPWERGGLGPYGSVLKEGESISECGLEDCDLIHTADEINRVVTWNGKADLNPLAARPIWLRVQMRNADLYAFQFR